MCQVYVWLILGGGQIYAANQVKTMCKSQISWEQAEQAVAAA
jgi:hypothetical protein